MSDAEFKTKMTELMVVLSGKVGDVQTTVAVNNEKTVTALKQIDEKVDDVNDNVTELKEDVKGVKEQNIVLLERIKALESKKSVFENLGSACKTSISFVKPVLSMISKFKAAILITTGLIIIFFGKKLGLDAQATIAILIQLFS